MSNATPTPTELDFLNVGNDLAEQDLASVGYPKLQHFNENHTYHAKTLIASGGYGIRNEDGTAPVLPNGKTETIKHRGGNSTIMMVATELEVALIGWTQRYYTAEFDDPTEPGKRVNQIVNHYFKPEELPGANGRCRQGITLFVALRADPEKKVYALDLRGFTVQDAEKLIVQAKMHASKLAAQVSKNTGKSVVVHPFAHWMKLGVAESRMVGKTEQSPISPPVWVEEPAAIVSKDEYAKFVDLRKDLDMFLPTSRYAPKAAPQLPSKSAPQLPAGDEDEGEWTIR